MTTLLFLSPDDDAPLRWLRIDDDDARVAAEGEGLPDAPGRVVAVVPAEAVSLHWAELPGGSTAQAVAAARLLVAEASATPAAELHVAIGDEGASDRPIGVVAAARMRDWLARLAATGVDPAALVPAPMLLPRPDEGYARAEIAGRGVVRGASAGFADEPAITALVAGAQGPVTVTPAALAAALAAAAAAPALDLRQGPFARRRRRVAFDARLLRRIGWLAVALLTLTLAIDLVRILRYTAGADALEAQAAVAAQAVLPRGAAVTDADRRLAERLAGLRGPGLGFAPTLAGVFAAIRTVPLAEVTALDFTPAGELRLSVAVQQEPQATELKRAIEAAGFTVEASVFRATPGRVAGEFTVRPR